jgi:4-alpha-glucanotransferase
VQDLLSLGAEARLNTPGTATGNWSWRVGSGALTPELAGQFAHLNGIFGRC